jgi:hypothetical protein
MAMNLKQRLNEQLDALASQQPGPDGGRPLCLDTNLGRLTLQLQQVDRLACALDRLALATNSPIGADTVHLKRIADDLSHRLAYLLEAIGPVELDHEACVVQLRSLPPSQDESGVSYFELLVRPTEIVLCRYSKSPGQPRRVIEATITREVLGRLIDDILAAVQSHAEPE